jgi:hypothetical protein
MDRTRIEERMNFTGENYMMREELLKIVYWDPETAIMGLPRPLAKDRIEAAKNVVMMDSPSYKPNSPTGCIRSPRARSTSHRKCARSSSPRGSEVMLPAAEATQGRRSHRRPNSAALRYRGARPL